MRDLMERLGPSFLQFSSPEPISLVGWLLQRLATTSSRLFSPAACRHGSSCYAGQPPFHHLFGPTCLDRPQTQPSEVAHSSEATHQADCDLRIRLSDLRRLNNHVAGTSCGRFTFLQFPGLADWQACKYDKFMHIFGLIFLSPFRNLIKSHTCELRCHSLALDT
ncbi:unnamed protein product [Protopolystoma xenopodis]|uniref:Uncharacterized protein n=1 Tax=Protopolystoma xenopodis TaxID=117903 RepID=A0A3S5AS45_9PLAT|nr:unnamed protein product [Protopolystoma xenopodis]